MGKVLLAVGLIMYTFVTMVGGNPLHELAELSDCEDPTLICMDSIYGFRNWKTPGPWAGHGASGRLESFVNAINVGMYEV